MKIKIQIPKSLDLNILENIKSYLTQSSCHFTFDSNHQQSTLEFSSNKKEDFNLSKLESISIELKKYIEVAERLQQEPLETYTSEHIKIPPPENIEEHLIKTKQIYKLTEGLYAFNAAILNDLESLDLWFKLLFQSLGAKSIKLPSLIDSNTLLKTAVESNISNQLYKVYSNNHLTHFCRSATCLTCYPLFQNQQLTELTVFTASGSSFRNEFWEPCHIFRMKEYTLREIILMGQEDEINSKLESIQYTVSQLFKQWKLSFTLNVATDHFTAEKVNQLSTYQLLKQNKLEFRVQIPYLKQEVAVGSLNRHETSFTKPFQITNSANETIHSACFGLGIERLLLAFYSHFGFDKSKWPIHLSDIFKQNTP